MNLATDPWIPVVMPDGQKGKVSLGDAFAKAADIRDLACNPPQRIALMRLLICIAQAGLDGPEDEKEWFECKGRITEVALKYLKEKESCFELFGKRPFMQIPGIKVAEGKSKPFDAMDFRLARGHMSVLFDHEATPEGRNLPHDQLALALVTLLNFSPCGRVGQSIWNGTTYSGYAFAAPCFDHAITFIRANDLLSTVHFNLLTKHGQTTGVSRLPNGEWGQPVWERFPRDVTDKEAFKNAGCTYLGRLVPLSRFVSLVTDSPTHCIIGPVHQGYRIDHLPAFREPWATVVQRREREMYLRLDEAKHMWRELCSLLSLRKTASGNGGSVSLCNLLSFFDRFPDKKVDVWVGGLKSGGGGGKFIDMMEWVFSVNPKLLHEETKRKHEAGVALAEMGEQVLTKAVRTCFTLLKVDGKSTPTAMSRQVFWAELDRQCGVLQEVAENTSERLGDQWYPLVLKAASRAYGIVCPRQTPRQIEAYAQGLDKLRLKKPEE